MELINTLVFKFPDLTGQRITSWDEGYIELHENYFRYVSRFDSEEPQNGDSDMPWVALKVDLDISIRKSNAIAIEKAYVQKEEKWHVVIVINGRKDDLWVYFENEEECQETFEKLHKYFFNGNNDKGADQ